MSTDFTLPIPDDSRRGLAIGWLWLGVAALLASGLFSVLLVLSRAPAVSEIIPWIDFFHVALVVHVDLSVLVWFLAFAGLLWSLSAGPRFMPLAWAGLWIAAAGTAIITFSPFLGAGNPLMSNYIPVLHHPIFFAGLIAFGVGFALLVVHSILALPRLAEPTGAGALRFGMFTASLSSIVALVAFIWSYLGMPEDIKALPEAIWYFERLWWGGGHELQFTYTLTMLVAWVWLASAAGLDLPVSPKAVMAMFFLAVAAIFYAPIIYLVHGVGANEHVIQFTEQMKYGGLMTIPLGAVVTYALLKGGPATEMQRTLRAALYTSIALFAIGGIIGFMIQGTNVIIPAHYHGSIVGVTLAMMGLTYALLPRLGYAMPALRAARVQLYVYSAGQLMHIGGLAWSGGYGVQRKVAGAAQGLDSLQKVAAMGIMGLGGAIAIVGGLLFLYVVLKSIAGRKSSGS